MKGTYSVLNSTKRAILALALLLIVPASLSAQKSRRGRTTPSAPPKTAPRTMITTTDPTQQLITLSAQDLSLLIEELGVPPQTRAQLAGSAKERKAFASDLREMFSVAEEAKAAKMDARPDTKIQLELSRAFVVARRYSKKRQAEGATSPEQIVSKEEVAAFVKEAGQEQKFQEFLQDYLKNRPQSEQSSALTDEERENLRQQWANVMLSARKGVAAGVDRERATQVMLMYQHARLLANEYFKQTLAERMKATDAEIEAYFTAHPDIDPKQTKAKAEEVLTKLRAGGDFNALAKEVSADPSNRDKGGDLGWFGRGMMVKPFEDAAFALKPGELSGVVETQFGYHIIKLDERRTHDSPTGQPAEEVRARHILIAPPAGANARPQSPRETARRAIEDEKRAKVLGEIVSRSRVMVAEDFDPNPVQVTPPPAAGTPATGASNKPATPAATTPAKGTTKNTRAGTTRRKRP